MLRTIRRAMPVVAALALVTGCSASFWSLSTINDAEVGGCVQEKTDGDKTTYNVIDCDEPDATYTVLKLKDYGSSSGCTTVPGTTVQLQEDSLICLGPKGADPSKAMNGAKIGDCVEYAGSERYLTDCDNPQATQQVYMVLTNVDSDKVQSRCDGVRNATSAYTWELQSTGGELDSVKAIDELTVSLVVCLGPKL
ncbi:hypothetical protein ACIA8K_40415 [Catenuloplanes sp. NPDC051500]|uniref:LppU/SCO3897 family protein n=1 Tax=Catenuloplanes sp. NPDC051500 TaxID=3363959 RepID=UPI003791776D